MPAIISVLHLYTHRACFSEMVATIFFILNQCYIYYYMMFSSLEDDMDKNTAKAFKDNKVFYYSIL